MAKKAKKKHRSGYRKATDNLEDVGRDQCFVMYGAVAIALWRYWGKRQLTITRLFEITGAVWQDCASTNMHSMIEMCEKETGVEVQIGNGKSWRDLPYLNSSIDQKRMSEAQWTYMRHQQAKWIPAQVMSCLMIAMHRKYHFGYIRLSRIYAQVEGIKAEFGFDGDRIREACFDLTKIDVADTTTIPRRESA